MKIHPDFSLTLSDLEDITASLPEDIRNNILGRPGPFLERVKEVLLLPAEFFLIADKNKALDESYIPADLVYLSNYPLSIGRSNLMLRKAVMPDILAMNESARQEGITLLFSSTYRSFEYQQTVYERNVKQVGKEQADRESAQPGKSQHQLGTTIDFGSITDAFGETDAGMWLYANAGYFGFSLSYPAGYESQTGYRHEIWHYRYITRPGCLLETQFFNSLQFEMLRFLNDNYRILSDARVQKIKGT